MTLRKRFMAVMAGGAAGAVSRGLVMIWASHTADAGEYLLLINGLGSLALGFTSGIISSHAVQFTGFSCFVGVGFLGSFTTFSAVSRDTLRFLQAGDWGYAALNLFVQVTLCLSLAVLGLVCARRVNGFYC